MRPREQTLRDLNPRMLRPQPVAGLPPDPRDRLFWASMVLIAVVCALAAAAFYPRDPLPPATPVPAITSPGGPLTRRGKRDKRRSRKRRSYRAELRIDVKVIMDPGQWEQVAKDRQAEIERLRDAWEEADRGLRLCDEQRFQAVKLAERMEKERDEARLTIDTWLSAERDGFKAEVERLTADLSLEQGVRERAVQLLKANAATHEEGRESVRQAVAKALGWPVWKGTDAIEALYMAATGFAACFHADGYPMVHGSERDMRLRALRDALRPEPVAPLDTTPGPGYES